MTTLLLSENFPPKTGGSGRWFWEVYRRLPRAEFVVAAGEDPRQDAFDRTHDLRLVRMPLTLSSWGIFNRRSFGEYWRAVAALRRLTRAEKVDRIHVGRCLPEGLMALALKVWAGIPFTCYVHGEEMNYASGSRELRWLMQQVVKHAESFIANSRNTRRILMEEWRVPAERVRLLHPGMDAQRFTPASPDPEVRRRLGWEGRAVVLTAGRLQKRKGQDQMILALHRVRRDVPNVLYAVVGDGEERPYLEALVAREGLGDHVQLLGELDDAGLVRCYQQCDLFVLPNRQVGQDIEGFGMVLVEAQACGKPVVAGASGGTAETMRVPETGRIVNCEGQELLAEVVAELLADPALRARMGEAARPWAVENFDWATLSRQAAALFQRGSAGSKAASPAEAVHA